MTDFELYRIVDMFRTTKPVMEVLSLEKISYLNQWNYMVYEFACTMHRLDNSIDAGEIAKLCGFDNIE